MRSTISGAKPGPVVADDDADLVVGPLRENLDPAMGEIDGVLDQIASP